MLPIVYLKNTEIDIVKWNVCITKAANALPYAYSWYLDIVAPNWEALVYGDYEVVMPLAYKTKLWQSYIFQPAWTQQLGIFSIHPLSQFLVHEFLRAIPPKFRWINMYLNEKNQFSITNFEVKVRFNYVLSLKKTYQQLYGQYNQNTRRNLKKAKANTVLNLQRQVSPETICHFFRQHIGAKIPQLKTPQYEQIIKIMYACIYRKIGWSIGVYGQYNELCAVGFFIESHGRIINILPATNEEGRKTRAMFLIIDDIIKKYANGHILFDFEGSMVESIARFYQGFGAKAVPYSHISQTIWQSKKR
ncbi:MAG: hypothetical protein ACPG5B_15190 [Chitinophagales bacterium]